MSPFIDTVTDFENGVDLKTIQSRFVEGVQTGDKSRMLVWAGSAVSLMEANLPARVGLVLSMSNIKFTSE